MGIMEKLKNDRREKPITHPGKIADKRKCGSSVARSATFQKKAQIQISMWTTQFLKVGNLLNFLNIVRAKQNSFVD